MSRKNYGVRRPNITGAGHGSIDLRSPDVRVDQRLAEVNALIKGTSKDLFIALVASRVALPAVGEAIDFEHVRRCARAAIAAAPYYAEAIGLVNITVPDVLRPAQTERERIFNELQSEAAQS